MRTHQIITDGSYDTVCAKIKISAAVQQHQVQHPPINHFFTLAPLQSSTAVVCMSFAFHTLSRLLLSFAVVSIVAAAVVFTFKPVRPLLPEKVHLGPLFLSHPTPNCCKCQISDSLLICRMIPTLTTHNVFELPQQQVAVSSAQVPPRPMP